MHISESKEVRRQIWCKIRAEEEVDRFMLEWWEFRAFQTIIIIRNTTNSKVVLTELMTTKKYIEVSLCIKK